MVKPFALLGQDSAGRMMVIASSFLRLFAGHFEPKTGVSVVPVLVEAVK